jgi:hypothetical protein
MSVKVKEGKKQCDSVQMPGASGNDDHWPSPNDL